MSADLAPSHPLRGPATCVAVPAQRRYLEILRPAVRIAMDGYGADATCATDIGLAVDELASVLIACAGSTGMLHVAVAQDPTDVHIELSITEAPAGPEPVLDELSRQLLDTTADAYATGRSERGPTGRLRRRLTDHTRWAGDDRDAVARNHRANPSDRR